MWAERAREKDAAWAAWEEGARRWIEEAGYTHAGNIKLREIERREFDEWWEARA